MHMKKTTMCSDIFGEMRNLTEEENNLYKDMKKRLGTALTVKPTNEERQNAARNIRNIADNIEQYDSYGLLQMIGGAIGFDYECDNDEIILRRIANLIDVTEL